MRWTMHLSHAVHRALDAWAGQSCHAVDGVLGHAVDKALMPVILAGRHPHPTAAGVYFPLTQPFLEEGGV